MRHDGSSHAAEPDVIEQEEIRRIEEAVRRVEAQQRQSGRPEAVVLVFAW